MSLIMDNEIFDNSNAQNGSSSGLGLEKDKTIELLQTPANEMAHMETELRLTLEEIARLQNALAEANMKIMSLKNPSSLNRETLEDSEILKPFITELYQSVHTSKGYLDLLLNESVGTLGTFQKRFVERISSSIDHMEELIGSLETLSGDEQEDKRDFTHNFSLIEVVEETLSIYTDQVRQKSITLKVDLVKGNTDFRGDKESFERVLNILFSNACLSAKEEGTIQISLRELKGKEPNQFLFSIQTYEPKAVKSKPMPVFLDHYKDQQIILDGFALPISDLQTARQLTETMHGVMEVFSMTGSGSLIRLRIPITITDVRA